MKFFSSKGEEALRQSYISWLKQTEGLLRKFEDLTAEMYALAKKYSQPQNPDTQNLQYLQKPQN